MSQYQSTPWWHDLQSTDVRICYYEFIVLLNTLPGFIYREKLFLLTTTKTHERQEDLSQRSIVYVRTKYRFNDAANYSTFATSSTGFRIYESGGFVKDRKNDVFGKWLV